jgi:hypothetical protein
LVDLQPSITATAFVGDGGVVRHPAFQTILNPCYRLLQFHEFSRECRQAAGSSMQPITRYAKSADVHIAYQAFGEGPINLVLAPPFISNIEHWWDEPNISRWLLRLARYARVVMFDKRGTGMSDRVSEFPGWSEVSLFEKLGRTVDSAELRIAREIFDWMRRGGKRELIYGTGKENGSVYRSLNRAALALIRSICRPMESCTSSSAHSKISPCLDR